MFFDFWLIIMAVYQLKPASRSLYITSLGADRLPYVWIGSAMAMAVFISFYNRIVERMSRLNVVMGSCLAFTAALILFRLLLITPSPLVAIGFYVFVDILGVILVEQFWSLCNSIYDTEEGKRWYGVVGTGGLVGGMMGGGLAGALIRFTPLKTPDLLLVAGALIIVLYALTWLMGRGGIYCEVDGPDASRRFLSGDWRSFMGNPYLLLLAGVLLLAQLASPIVEYQFMKTVESSFAGQEARTAFLSLFFGLLGMVSIVVNLGITPLVHRFVGVIAGLLIQPVILSLFSLLFWMNPSLFFGSAAKISDRALANSINRASRELLYVPVDPILIYQAKAWIDMLGFRLFKVLGSVLILLFTQWLPVTLAVPQFSGFSIAICILWMGLIFGLRKYYLILAGSGG